MPTFSRLAYRLSRIIFLTTKGTEENRLFMRAGSLTFITVLSIVPLFAFAFSVAKGFGAYETLQAEVIQPFLDRTLPVQETEEGGTQVREGIETVFSVVEGTRVSSLGTFGLIILLYTVLKLLSSIEQTFNDIWGVRRARTLVRKIADYLSICVVVPILLLTATAVSAAVRSDQALVFVREKLGLGALVEVYAKSSSLIAVWVGFTFVFLFMPNTRVRIRSALLGGIIGGTLWQLAQLLHVRFQVGVANYNAIYSTFAALPIFLFWLYMSWCTVLLGAQFAFAHQNEPMYRQLRMAKEQDGSSREGLAMRVMMRVARRFLDSSPPQGIQGLSSELDVPESLLEDVLTPLVARGLLVRGEEGSEDQGILLARDPGTITALDVLDAIAHRLGAPLVAGVADQDVALADWLKQLEQERTELPSNRTLRDFIADQE